MHESDSPQNKCIQLQLCVHTCSTYNICWCCGKLPSKKNTLTVLRPAIWTSPSTTNWRGLGCGRSGSSGRWLTTRFSYFRIRSTHRYSRSSSGIMFPSTEICTVGPNTNVSELGWRPVHDTAWNELPGVRQPPLSSSSSPSLLSELSSCLLHVTARKWTTQQH